MGHTILAQFERSKPLVRSFWGPSDFQTKLILLLKFPNALYHHHSLIYKIKKRKKERSYIQNKNKKRKREKKSKFAKD